MVAGKAGKAAVDGIKTASHKVTEGVNFVASTAKGFADKIGSLWNKGATTVKTTFLQGNEKIQHAVKTLMEYKWIPGEGKGFAMAGVGNVSGGGQYSLKEAYQYMESKVVKGTGKGSTVSEVKTFVDKGEQFTNGRKNRLKPDIRYKTGEYDYFYETDNLGRIEKFKTDKLQLTEREKRLSHSKNTPGKVKGQDHAGHLAGDRFGGSPKIDNLVSQLSDVNLKKYKKVEDKWAAALKETPPKKVTVKVDIIYSGNDVRPDKFIVNYTIDGKPGSAKFKNL